VVLFAITGSLRAIIELQGLPNFVTYRDVMLPTALPAATSPPIAVVEPAGDVAVAVAPGEPTPTGEPLNIDIVPGEPGIEAYFRAITVQRDRLQKAVQDYRTATEQSQTVLSRVVAARKLSNEVGLSYAALAAVEPPAEAEQAHRMYLDGLAKEGQALQDLLDFYSSYDTTAANRATLRLQEAHAQIANARAAWDALVQDRP
jgi:hypothetical protein